VRALLIPVLLLGIRVASAQDAPLEIRNLRALTIPFLRIDPRGEVLPRGEKQLTLDLSAANTMQRFPKSGPDVRVYEDYEIDRLLARYRIGLGHNLDATIDLPFVSRGGGVLDPLIDGYHKLVLGGLPGNPRTGVPYGRSDLFLAGQGNYGSAAGVGDISATITKQFSDRVLATIAVKLPTGNARQILGSGGFDAGIAAQYRLPLDNRWSLHGQLGFIAQGGSIELRSVRGLVHQAALALTYRANSRDTYIGQWQSEDSATVTGDGGSDSGHRLVSVGYRRRLSARQTFEAYFMEDGDWLNYRVPDFANLGPDFTLGIRLTTRF